MNLTIEQMREISNRVSWGSHYRVDTDEVICCHNEDHFYFQDMVKQGVKFIRLDSIRAAIEDHDRADYVSDIRNHISPTTKVIER